MILNAVAIDDEPMALEVIKSHASKVPFLDLKATFFNAMQALEYVKENQVDIVFLDINMPDLTGLDFSQLLPSHVGVIFTTAYSQYAADAFNLNAIDYLVKPFDFVRFMKACQKALDSKSKEDNEAEMPYLFVKDSYDLVRIVLANLLYVQSEGNYLTFKETDKKTVTRMTMTEAIDLLPAKGFMRVHKSYLVNLNHIQKVERHQVSVADKEYVPIAANYHSELMDALKQIWTVK
jgi:two-component system, LytTR family, response regulator